MRALSRLAVRALPLLPRALVWRVAQRYVAGAERADALDTVRELNENGALATIDVLGEEVTDRAMAEAAADEYVRLFEVIDEQDLATSVSIKLTMLGLEIDEGFCRDNVERIVAAAAARDNFVRIDMEDRTTTAATLRIYHRLFERYGNLGVVLQAYMRRTLDDIEELPSDGANVRLCKGIYVEPRRVAWKGYETVRANFLAALRKLLDRGAYVGVATHDEYLLCGSVAEVDARGLGAEDYELQMLLGVEEELRDILIDRGHPLRVYVPYGQDWYAYSLRRLRENPVIAGHVMRAFFGRLGG